MTKLKITAGGQVSLPADIRRRWGTKAVYIEDLGDHAVVRPFPDDPIAAAMGLWKDRGISTDELRRQAREDEAIAEARRWGS
ncbi:MAG TPA: AbrB/MazE/SpoVT family DNA-binding domain-containing protein [Gaiellaceae bacterium]|nr:AbrB/MazE/SpoVT family DNA-binding domain-containing protein [Gaiellaceae bacterium]